VSEPQEPFAGCEIVEFRPPLRVALDAARAIAALPLCRDLPLALRVKLAVALERVSR